MHHSTLTELVPLEEVRFHGHVLQVHALVLRHNGRLDPSPSASNTITVDTLPVTPTFFTVFFVFFFGWLLFAPAL